MAANKGIKSNWKFQGSERKKEELLIGTTWGILDLELLEMDPGDMRRDPSWNHIIRRVGFQGGGGDQMGSISR